MRCRPGDGPVPQFGEQGTTMFVKSAVTALVSAVALTSLAADASADHRKRHRRAIIEYYAGPETVRVPRPMQYIFGGYVTSEDEIDAMVDDADRFDESYYDPSDDVTDEAPVRKVTKKPVAKTVTKAPLAKPIAKLATTAARASSEDSLTTASIAAKDDETAPTAKASAKPATRTASATLSCDKAGQIVAGYGFSNVKPHACASTIYEFDASRDGKNFAIKLDSTNGELTEVRKLQ